MNVKRLRIILATAFSSLGLICGVLGFTGVLNDRTSSKKYAAWMSQIDDHTLLRDIDMPGSHNTMSRYALADLTGQCQTLSLSDQLNLGVRFLDIRLKEENNSLKAVHGIIDEKASLASINKTIASFIKKNPSEFLILSIKEEVAASKSNIPFEEALIKVLDSDIYLKDQRTLPTYLEEVRGKVLILSRYPNNTIGIPAYDGWEDSKSFTLPNDIYVQDSYRIDNKAYKQEEIVRCFNESGHALKINFLSAYRTDKFPPSNAMSIVKDINPWINKEIDNYPDRGIVLYDYITEENMNIFFKEANK